MTPEQQAAGLTSGENLLLRKLAEFFPADVIRAKPQAVKGNRALAAFYLDPRAIMDRLDAVVGVDGWQDDYTPIQDGSVICRLKIRVGDRWIKKTDVGGTSEQPDAGDRLKAAFSDALKRAAVKFGVGRYVYRIPQQWCDYDPQKRQFTRPPQVPAQFLPRPSHVRGKEDKPAHPSRPVVNGVARLLPMETEQIEILLKEWGGSPQLFIEHYDIPEVSYLPADKYALACKGLRERIERNKTESTNSGNAA